VAVVGPNGAGKTTLIKCICRIFRGGTGQIRVAGQELGHYSQRRLALRMSYVPQADGQVPPFTAHEFVMMGRYPHLSPFSSPTEEDEHAVRRALAVTDTEEFAERSLATLSGGERQKVFLAAALAQEADVLLVDEPTTFLDPKHRADICHLLATVNREHGLTIVAVTHDINRAVLTSSRVVALKQGRIVFSGGPDDFMDNDVLRNIYDISFTLVTHPVHGKTIVAPAVPL
jgi:iron complex transport system ATP-binding protein